MNISHDTAPKAFFVISNIHFPRCDDSIHVFGNCHNNIGSMGKLVDREDRKTTISVDSDPASFTR
jgi:hypothetical protein